MGDTIKLTGSVLAYAGIHVDRANLPGAYTGNPDSLIPGYLDVFLPAHETEIAYGESNTDSLGKFNIQFIARPDKILVKRQNRYTLIV